MATPYISMAGIGKSFGPVHALKSVNLTVYPGEIHALLGENGAGKSTLMKVLSGIHEPTKGTITINNINYNKLDHKLAAQLGIGIIYQELSVIDELTVLENLYIGRHLTKKICGVNIIDWREMRVRAAMMLLRVGLKVDLDEKVANLSISHKQMLEIAKTLMLDAKVIIMDEPTVAVDPQSRNKILEGILELNRQGSTIIYTSHYMEEVEQICTRIAIIDHGRVLASGTTEELKKMIKTGETITIEAVALTKNNLADIRSLSHVFDLSYQDQTMILRCSGAKHNLIRVLNYLQEQDIPFGRVFSELPTLNDVFLEITGKELRD